MIEDYEHIKHLALEDVEVLKIKGQTYGSSWRNRGGVGAFMMLARKWDRIENMVSTRNYDIFKIDTSDKNGVLDDIQDLRRYLLLVESHLTAPMAAVASPGMGYMKQTRTCPVVGCDLDMPHTHPTSGPSTASGQLKI